MILETSMTWMEGLMIEPNIVTEQQPADFVPQNIPIEKPKDLTGVKR